MSFLCRSNSRDRKLIGLFPDQTSASRCLISWSHFQTNIAYAYEAIWLLYSSESLSLSLSSSSSSSSSVITFAPTRCSKVDLCIIRRWMDRYYAVTYSLMKLRQHIRTQPRKSTGRRARVSACLSGDIRVIWRTVFATIEMLRCIIIVQHRSHPFWSRIVMEHIHRTPGVNIW